MANIFEQLAANHEFITRFKDDAKKAIQSLIDSGQIAADANQVILLPHITKYFDHNPDRRSKAAKLQMSASFDATCPQNP